MLQSVRLISFALTFGVSISAIILGWTNSGFTGKEWFGFFDTSLASYLALMVTAISAFLFDFRPVRVRYTQILLSAVSFSFLVFIFLIPSPSLSTTLPVAISFSALNTFIIIVNCISLKKRLSRLYFALEKLILVFVSAIALTGLSVYILSPASPVRGGAWIRVPPVTALLILFLNFNLWSVLSERSGGFELMSPFRPALYVLKHIRYPYKFAILYLLFSIPFSALTFFEIAGLGHKIDAANVKISGIEYSDKISGLFEMVLRRRGMMNAYLNGFRPFDRNLALIEKRIHRQIGEIDRMKGIAARMTGSNKNWVMIRGYHPVFSRDPSISPDKTWRASSLLIDKIIALMEDIGANLSIGKMDDPLFGRLSYIYHHRLPRIIDTTGRLRGLGSDAMSQGKISPNQSSYFDGLISTINFLQQDMTSNMNMILIRDSDLYRNLRPQLDKSRLLVQKFIDTGTENIIKTSGANVSPEQFFVSGSTVINAFFDIHDKLSDLLISHERRVAEDLSLRRYKFEFVLLFLLGLMAYLFIVYLFSIREVVGQFTKMEKAVDSLLMGRHETLDVDTDRTDELGGIFHLFKNVLKILLRDRTELKNSEERFRKIVASSPNMVILIHENKIVYINESARNVLAVTGGDFSEIKLERVLDPKSADTFFGYLKRALEGSNTDMVRIRFRGLTGERIATIASFVSVDLYGDPHAYVLARNVTREGMLQLDLDRMYEAVQQAAEGVVFTDSVGTIIYINKAFEKITGYHSSELVGNHTRILKSGEHDGDFYSEMWSKIASGQVWTGKIRNRRKDGSIYTAKLTISPIYDDGGNIVNYISLQQDITKEVALEKRLYEMQRLESLGILSAGIAHDFNNMLTTVLGSVSLIQRRDCLHPRAQTYLEHIEDACKAAADLCKQLLVYAGRGKLLREPIILTEKVKKMIRVLKVSIPKKIELKFDLMPDLPQIIADTVKIEQIILNVAINASDAIGDRPGKIFISTDATRDNKYVRLTISDTGCGMSAETKARLFDPFFTTKLKGRGLGMSAVKGIVESHGGNIEVDSKQGKGATFRFYFPIAAKKITVQGSKEHRAVKQDYSGVVLVVDDEEDIRNVATIMLSKIGFSVISARNGSEAIDLYRYNTDKISLVLLDWMMPKMDGVECLRELKKIKPDVRVIMASGFMEEDARKKLEQESPSAFLPKPYGYKDLLSKIETVLGQAA